MNEPNEPNGQNEFHEPNEFNEPLPPKYDPGAVELALYRRWEERGYFQADAQAVLRGEREPYVIVIPPPNVTAMLHMGHGLNNTVQDVLTRWQRMRGREALWLPGTDHAGIATQNVVERQLAAEGRTRYDLGRKGFIERVWAWVDETGSTILEQLRSIGASCDWSRTRFTLDPGLSRAVREVFVRLYEKGLIYRGSYIINWCPRCLTALSDEEAEPTETEGKLYHLRYPIASTGPTGGVIGRTAGGTVAGAGEHAAGGAAERAAEGTAEITAEHAAEGTAEPAAEITAERTAEATGEPAAEGTPERAGGAAASGEGARTEALPQLPDGRRYVVVATTRPETMLGDTAVAVHPEDARYRGLVGSEVALPLTGRRIPIIADQYVDPAFGTGALKITPGHDPNDFDLGRRHDLPVLDVMTPEATMSDDVPPAFRGLDRFEAREQVVQALRAEGLVERIEAHTHAVPHCYRCDTPVEPRVSDQWFVRMKPLAEPALAASREGRVRFTPEHWGKTYEHWLENIRDWCISRQLWWGHRIPVWYCQAAGCGELIAAREDPTECPACGGAELEQDPDVLDTWFSSWLWPFSTLGWPEETDDLKAFYPTSTLVTGPDIIFFWVARMIMAGIELMGEAPFADVYLNGIVRDHHRRKMSKSLGNGIDPLEVVQLYGADALRFTVISGAGLGTDLFLNYENLDEAFARGRNFVNKLWNAGRFALMNLEGQPVRRVEDVVDDLELADRWILSRLSAAVAEVTRHLEAFRLHEATEAMHQFFWNELADWYIELIKPRLSADADPRSREAAQATLVAALDTVFRLLHPFTPFVTEALWQRLPLAAGVERAESLVVADWPEPPPAWAEDADAEAAITHLIDVVQTVRMLRSEYGVSPRQTVEVRVVDAPEPLRTALAAEAHAIQRLPDARVGKVVYLDSARDTATGHAGDGHAGAHAVLRSGAELFVPLGGIIDLDRERARLSRELDRLADLLRSTDRKLANQQFVSKAPAEVVERERARASSVRDQRERLSRKLQALA